MKNSICVNVTVSDNSFCNMCIRKSKQDFHRIVLIVILLFAVFPIVLLGQEDDANYSPLTNDKMDMNIHGDLYGFTEKSYYTIDDYNNDAIAGGLFDGASFLSCVYFDEHIARLFYKKWFLSQVSDCEIQFDENGNIALIRSIWDDGGQVYFTYDDYHRMIEMDTRSEARNQDEGVIRYYHKTTNNQIVEETLSINNSYGQEQINIKYQYDAHKNLVRAIMEYYDKDFFFNYRDNKINSIYLKDYWGAGIDGSYQITYNSNGDIQSVTSKREGFERTAYFMYQYDSHNNWINRIGSIATESGTIIVSTTRSYNYSKHSTNYR